MSVVKIVLLLLAWFFIVGTALPLVREPEWWIRIFDFPRVQISVAMLLILAAFGIVNIGLEESRWYEWVTFAVLGLCLAYQAVRIYPYTPLARVQTESVAEGQETGPRLRLLVSNVLMENEEYTMWLDEVRAADPDVIVAVETDSAWMAAADALEAEGYTHTVKVPQNDTYGILVYSRLPLIDPEVRYVVQDDVPSVWTHIELPEGPRVQAVFIHPRPPRPDIQQSSAERDAELVLVAREIAEHDGPTLVAGDLNDVAWSTTTSLFQKISRLLDPRVGRGTLATFSAEHWWARWPLDHVFHTEDFQLVDLRRLGYVGSDHFPMLIELALTPGAEARQAPPDLDADDVEESQEVLEDAQEQLPDDPDVAPEDR